jgi:tetratricopeptide (TPR) repeat protein
MFQRHFVLAGFVCFLSFAVGQTAPTDATPDGSQTAPSLQAVPHSSASPGTLDPQHNAIASTWIWQAEFRLKSKDLEGASQSLAKARQINEHERNLWLVTGDLDWRRGQTSEAIDDYKKEADQHPDNPLAHERMAAAYLHEGDWTTGIAEEHKWAEVAPKDVMPYAALGYALS